MSVKTGKYDTEHLRKVRDFIDNRGLNAGYIASELGLSQRIYSTQVSGHHRMCHDTYLRLVSILSERGFRGEPAESEKAGVPESLGYLKDAAYDLESYLDRGCVPDGSEKRYLDRIMEGLDRINRSRRKLVDLDRIPETLRKMRLQSGMTQKELGEMAGVSQNFICQLETGRKAPSVAILRNIYDALYRPDGPE